MARRFRLAVNGYDLGYHMSEWFVGNSVAVRFHRQMKVPLVTYLVASAPTGSGKTIAFLGPLLVVLGKPGKEFARILIIDPTRELAKQTLDEFVKLTAGRKWTARVHLGLR